MSNTGKNKYLIHQFFPLAKNKEGHFHCMCTSTVKHRYCRNQIVCFFLLSYLYFLAKKKKRKRIWYGNRTEYRTMFLLKIISAYSFSPQYKAVVLSPLQKSTRSQASQWAWFFWDDTHHSSYTARGVYTKSSIFYLIWSHILLLCPCRIILTWWYNVIFWIFFLSVEVNQWWKLHCKIGGVSNAFPHWQCFLSHS